MLVGSSSFLQQFVSETLQEPKLGTSYGSFHSWSKRNNWSSQCVPVIKHSRGLACLMCIAETIDHESPTKFSDKSKWKDNPYICQMVRPKRWRLTCWGNSPDSCCILTSSFAAPYSGVGSRSTYFACTQMNYKSYI
jgi:hypothetical protein